MCFVQYYFRLSPENTSLSFFPHQEDDGQCHEYSGRECRTHTKRDYSQQKDDSTKATQYKPEFFRPDHSSDNYLSDRYQGNIKTRIFTERPIDYSLVKRDGGGAKAFNVNQRIVVNCDKINDSANNKDSSPNNP